MADLKIKDLHKYYGPVHAVRGVDLEIPAREFAVLVALNGLGMGLFTSPNRAEMMNSVPAGVAGTVVEVCATNAEPVEYGDPLFTVRPDA